MFNSRVVVWLKIRKHDIVDSGVLRAGTVVVWLKIRKHDISPGDLVVLRVLWFD